MVDGAYAKQRFPSRTLKDGAIAVSRLRKDAALFDVPKPVKRRGKDRPRNNGKRLSLAHYGGHRQSAVSTAFMAKILEAVADRTQLS